jgi:hypothetical protein
MAQVGHADESTTLQIYARVMKRRPREAQHAAFDALIASGGRDGSIRTSHGLRASASSRRVSAS